MDTINKYIAVAVVLLFVAGICLVIAAVRQQNRTRKPWGGLDRQLL